MIDANEKGFIRIVTKKVSEEASNVFDSRETTYKNFDSYLLTFDKSVKQNGVIGLELISGAYIVVPVSNVDHIMYVPNSLLEKKNG